jgi:hypothetical protein
VVLVERVDGVEPESWDALRGRGAVFYVYAPWADGAAAAEPWLAELNDRAIPVVPVLVDRRSHEERMANRQEGSAPADAIWGNEDILNALGGIRALPTAVWLDQNGDSALRWEGHVPAAQIIEELTTLAAPAPLPDQSPIK